MVKQRARRGVPPLPAATVVIRGDLLDPDVLHDLLDASSPAGAFDVDERPAAATT